MEGTGLTHFVLLNYSDEFIIRNVDVSLHEKKKKHNKNIFSSYLRKCY